MPRRNYSHILGTGGVALCGSSVIAGQSNILYYDTADGAPVYRQRCGNCIGINGTAQEAGCSVPGVPAQSPRPPAPLPQAAPPEVQYATPRGGVHIKGSDGVSLCGYSDGTPDVPCGNCAGINGGAQQAGVAAMRSASSRAAFPGAAPSGRVFVSSRWPASNVTLHGPRGEPLPARGMVAGAMPYIWAFEHHGPRNQGDRFLFRSDEQEIVCEAGADGALRTIEARTLPTAATIQVVERATITSSATRPKVSVVTCSYNRPDLLRRACESLRAQTDGDWEHLICDDASSDPRVAATLTWAQEDRRVRVWRRSANADRPAVLWNHMLDRAMGRFFTALDDDNEKLPQFVERLAGELDANPGIDLVTCGWVVVQPNGAGDYHLNLSTAPSNLNQQSTCDGGAVMYRREIFERAGYFAEDIRTNEDWSWMRKAVRASNVLNLNECFSTYRVHGAQRMTRCYDLGNDADVARVRAMLIHDPFGVRVVRPPQARLTRSQEDAIGAAERGLRAAPWICQGDDLAVVLSPFQMTDADIAGGLGGAPVVLSVHIEDPYAQHANLERVRGLIATGREIWVSTNDASSVPAYRGLVGDRVMVCPLLGVDSTVAPGAAAARDIDVLLCGYAYPSRRRFVDDLLPRLAGLRVVLVGDGWEDRPCEHLPTQDLLPTYGLYARAKTIIVSHRVGGDCSDGPAPPATVNRCYSEGYFGARVFVDQTRPQHSMEAGDVEWYSGPADLAEKLRAALAGGADPAADPRAAAFAARCGLLYSYPARMARIINCVRAPRYLAEIP